MSATFAAKWPGICAEGDKIEQGQEVTYTVDNLLAHVDCASGAAPKVSRLARKCEGCFMVHTGECL